MEDTICAISTAPGIGAVSIIRISGKDSINIVSKIFSNKKIRKSTGNRIFYGFIMNKKEKIDEVLVTFMKSPKTYTKEDVVEINCHGGLITTKRILELLLTNGCRLAEPGEFTKRAFLNGRIDLVQAEAVQDLINSKTESERKMFINQIDGKVSKKISDLRNKILSLMANIEVNIDFPEYEDAIEVTNEILKPELKKVKDEILDILKDSKNGKIIKEGIDVSILGKPNVGKSSILNALLKEEKAIVTDIAGTTRDIIEGTISLNGYLLNLKDTAGLRKTKNIVEKIGVNRSLETISNSDLLIYVLNNNEEVTKEDLKVIKENKDKTIVFINKTDLESKLNIEKLKDFNIVKGNTIEQKGLEELKNKIIEMFNLEKIETKDLSYLSNAREISELDNAYKYILEVEKGIKNNASIDMLEIDLRNCWNSLGSIIGEVYQDELLDELFSKFCLGK